MVLMNRATPAVALLGLIAALGCGTAFNYPSPVGPRYAGGPAGGASGAPPPGPGIVRVITFNIQFGRQVDRAIELLQSAEPAKSADIATLQEVDARGTRRIAEALGMFYVYYPSAVHPKTGRDFGNAVLSRWPIAEDWKIVLPHHGRFRDTERAATGATILVGNDSLRVYSVHLSTMAELDPSARREQARAVIADAAPFRRVIVGGDLNGYGIGEEFLACGFLWPTEHNRYTVMVFNWDHIFLRGMELRDSASTGVLDEDLDVSDHRVVWAVVSLAPPGADGEGPAAGAPGASSQPGGCAALQEEPDSGAADSVEVVPGPRYGAGWLQRWLLGTNHRNLWTQSVKLERLDLARLGGGLTPECRGDGFEMAPLRLLAADRRRYLFRPVDQSAMGLPPPLLLRRPAAADVFRDRVSSRHPAAAPVVVPLLDAAGVLHPEPELRVMPDAADLGTFRDGFAGVLGTVEERPGDGFAGADRVEGTEDLWARIDASPADQVDARSYLTARLIDILVGDWDRQLDRWSWAGYPSGEGRVWRPISRDWDQAFARLEGVVAAVARRYLPQLVSFGPSYPDMSGLTWSARALDRRFLVGLDKAAWDSVARAVQGRITDRVLETAVGQLPAELRRAEADELLLALTRRRNQLLDAADALYPLVAEYADVRATGQDDWVEVDRAIDGRVRVRMALAGAPDVPYFERTFRVGETREVRIYLNGGNDRVVVRGATAHRIAVRVVGGLGDDRLTDSSRVGLPVVRHLLTSTFFYDADGHDAFVAGPGTEIDRRPFEEPARRDVSPTWPQDACGAVSGVATPPRELGSPFRDWGSRWVPTPWVSFQPNVGLLIGAGAERYGYAFRKAPYGSRVTIRGAYATGVNRLRVWYEGDFRNLPRGAWGSLSFRYSGIDILRFHGFGNATELTAPTEFYQVTQRQVAAAASVIVFPPNSRISVGPFVGFSETELGRGNLVDSLRPYGVDPFLELGAQARLELDTRDRAPAPRRGVHLMAQGRVVPKGLDVTQPYGSVSGEAATYLSVGDPARVTLAVRAGAKRVWGRYPFYAAAYLGGATTLRGYNEQRFAGDAVTYGNGEVRLFLTKFSVLLPGELGLLALGDVGRAFLAGERSDRWHSAVGGGAWMAFIERGSTVTVTVARSPERWAFYAGLGFMF